MGSTRVAARRQVAGEQGNHREETSASNGTDRICVPGAGLP